MSVIISKFCPKCKMEKPLSDFHNNKTAKDGKQSQCNQCHKNTRLDYKKRKLLGLPLKQSGQPKKLQKFCSYCGILKSREDFGEWKGKIKRYCIQCTKKAQQEYQALPDRKRSQKNSYLKRKYNITIEDYELLLEKQNSFCAICKTNRLNNKENAVLAVDHDHNCCPGDVSCGRCVRGLLCDLCNRGIGYLKENIDILKCAIVYLKKGI